MMINKRLIGVVPESKKFIALNVLYQWIALLANVVLIASICTVLALAAKQGATTEQIISLALIAVAMLVVRYGCNVLAHRMSFYSSKAVKKTLREQIYAKLLRLGNAYRDHVQTSEVVQVAVEGVDQIELYFGQYLPQFFYAMLAPLTLFIILAFINLPAALVLLVCVPLIPIAIALVQTWAKKLLSKYWGQYTALGDSFLENLQGLTTLKIYQSDGYKNEEMNLEAERFRVITMKVLQMQLNSITIMDFIAYGGAALGLIVAMLQYQAGAIGLFGALFILLLAADFFIPMRLLGSYFHVAMNGMAAIDKIFALLDTPEGAANEVCLTDVNEIMWSGVCFGYDAHREILQDINLRFTKGRLSAIVGASGSGKSTIAGILMGRNRGYQGSIRLDQQELNTIAERSLLDQITYVSHHATLFKGTIRENLLMGNPDATDQALWEVLEQVKMADFASSHQGLDTVLQERAANVSGGQRQRLTLARALLHDTPVYVFDEATSSIDVESEQDIMDVITQLAKTKMVIVISHRLAHVVAADCIYVLEHGVLQEQGSHEAVVANSSTYAALWNTQQALENVRIGG
ncbi:MAG: ABC transporter ATP-binding protein/permease [Erysipelotrichaceae bacterium]